MKLQPVKAYILVQFYQPEEAVIKTTRMFEAPLEDNRTRVEVLAVGPDVKCCKVGDFLLLSPKPNILPINLNSNIFLTDEVAVLGIVEDDTADNSRTP